MKSKENYILKKLKLYRIYNNFIPFYVKKKLRKLLIYLKVPPHTIEVFFNPYTSPFEQYEIIKYFKHKHDKNIKEIIKQML
jgi:hypothetical protein